MAASKSKFEQKLRKLGRDPRAFLRDSKMGKAALGLTGVHETTNVTDDSPPARRGPVTTKAEPRVLLDIRLDGPGTLVVERFDRKIAEPCLATAIFCSREGLLIQQPLLDIACRKPTFVGFKDRYLFAVRTDLESSGHLGSSIDQLFSLSEKEWKNPILPNIRNAVFFNPRNALVELVKSTNPWLRTIAFCSEEPSATLVESNSPVDVLVSVSSIDVSACPALRRIKVSGTEGFVPTLRELIIDHKDKEKNMFVPIYGTARPLHDIDELLASNVDGVIQMKPGTGPIRKSTTFDAVVTQVAQNLEFLMVREEGFIRYQDFCDGDPTRFLLQTMRDGFRYEIRR